MWVGGQVSLDRIAIRDPDAKASVLVTAERLIARRATGEAVFSFPENK